METATSFFPSFFRDLWVKHRSINQRLVIIAPPGYGKTTLTRYLTLSYADQDYRSYKAKALIPFLLLFRTIHSQIIDDTKPLLPELIAQNLKTVPGCQDLNPSQEWLVDWLKSGECLVMLDGLDEVPQARRKLVSKWANWQMEAYNTTFILTSRPHGYDNTLFQGVYPLKIIDFNNDQKSEFIDNWYQNRIWMQWYNLYQGSQLKLKNVEAQSKAEAEKAAADLKRQLFANSALNELAKNPLLVTIIAATHEAFEFLPKERTSLYKKIFNLLLETRPNIRETRLSIKNAEDNQKVLQELALKSLEQSQLQFTPEQALPWIERKLLEKSGEPSLTPKKFLREIQTIAGLLAGGTEEGGLYQFTHKTFQEYLAALELKEQGQEDLLIEQFYNPDWQEVIVFYSTLTSSIPFLRIVLERTQDISQDRKYELKLARRLVEESGKVDKQMRQQLDLELEQEDLGDESNFVISLDQKIRRNRNLTRIDAQMAISEPITWGEYQLFLNDQASGKFHSSAELRLISPGQKNQPVTRISNQDGQWFCAWLSTQINLQSDDIDIVYNYHLPSYEEINSILSEVDSVNFLRIIRVEIPNRYQALLNYLANGRWREADEETANLMLEVAGQKERGYLQSEDIKKFSCEDLRIINQLWLKFSGNHFGFSVQKEIYESLGGGPSYDSEVFDKFYERVGWTEGGTLLNYEEYAFDLNSLIAHLPSMYFNGTLEVSDVGISGNVEFQGFAWVTAFTQIEKRQRRRIGYLFSRANTCNL
ncbi:MAG: GUN4 domain-containing protein [Cyanobacteria bacterium P01_F01_bin.143]